MTVPIRRKARELALQVLYQTETTGIEEDSALELVLENFQADKKAVSYARSLIDGVLEERSKIDGLIEDQSEHWRMERMAMVDRNILRIAAYEVLYVKDVPATVAINEALEIAKRYAEPESIRFINGILDNLQGKDAS